MQKKVRITDTTVSISLALNILEEFMFVNDTELIKTTPKKDTNSYKLVKPLQ